MKARLASAWLWLSRVAVLLVVLYAGFAGSMYWLMTQPPQQFAAVMAKLAAPAFLLLPFESMWLQARAGDLQVGDVAPDFRLPALDQKSTVALSSFRGVRPVVLVFGSYT